MSYFLDTAVNIVGNSKLRNPQIEAYLKIQDFFKNPQNKEALVVLPTGTGKTGLISIAPFDVSYGRVLIITPGLVTKQSIQKTQEVLNDNFWVNFDVIFNPEHLPILNEYIADISNEHLNASNIVYSNIQRLTKTGTGLIHRVPPDFFDLIIIDEAHHAPAQSWITVLGHFKEAKKLYLTGTPFRGDNQDIPGIKIHETFLSEVMRDRYVKWLRKETVNAHELYFTIASLPGVHLTKEQVLEFKEKEWIEKSVALSKECSLDVIDHSILKLTELKESSPSVPHKILAIGCSIKHAEDLVIWYKEKGFESIIVHSDMTQEELSLAFMAIDNHQCQVVISVNMLMEGYDHKYLSILSIFRPYRSLNAFAQVVGRVLRAIPESEITAFEIDNNAVVIYHQETGLDFMWAAFQKEIDRAKHTKTKEYGFLDREYIERDHSLAGVSTDDSFISEQTSYLDDIDFNKLFEAKRAEISKAVEQKLESLRQNPDLDEDDIELLKNRFIEKAIRATANNEIDPNLVEKRPAQARKKIRQLLTDKIQNEVANLLSDLGLSDKGTELVPKFIRLIAHLKGDMPNDGTLVRFINAKLYAKFGAVDSRDNDLLLRSIDTIPSIITELRNMLL